MRGSRLDAELPKAPTLINLSTATPVADPVTPSDNGPGTPNSTMTSMSELSTVAIKDGHRGHFPHVSNRDPNNPARYESERDDRISRMVGFDRLAYPLLQARSGAQNTTSSLPGGSASAGGAGGGGGGGSANGHGGNISTHNNNNLAPHQLTIGYFLPNGEPRLLKAQSTVGSASATSAATGSTATWTTASADDNDENVVMMGVAGGGTAPMGPAMIAITGATMMEKNGMNSESNSVMGETTTGSIWNGMNGGMSDGGSLVGFDEDASSRPNRRQGQNQQATANGGSGGGSGGGGGHSLGRPTFLPYSFPSHLRSHSPSSVSSYPPPSVGDSSCSRAGDGGGGRVDGNGNPISSTPPPQMDRDNGPPNGRNLTTVERAEVALRQRAQKK